MPNKFKIVTVGDATLDTFLEIHEASVMCDLNKKKCKLCFNYADKVPIHQARQSVGGDAANVAVGLAKLNYHTGIVTELGDDINGYTVDHELSSAGVQPNFITMVHGGTTRYSVVLTFKGERTILAYHPQHHYLKPKLPTKTEWLYFTSLGRGSEKIQDLVMKFLLKNPKTKLAINPGSYQLRDGLEHFRKIIPRADIIFVNREEAETIVGKIRNTKKLFSRLHKIGPRIIIITDGEKGSYASDTTQIYQQKNYPVKVVSKTGAGDAYASGFLGAILANHDIPTAMQWGTANAAGVIQQYGAQSGLLSEAAIKKMIKKYQ